MQYMTSRDTIEEIAECNKPASACSDEPLIEYVQIPANED